MLKQAFLKGFFKRIGRFTDDIHRTAKSIEKGVIKIEQSPELEKFVAKELSATRNFVKKELGETKTQVKELLQNQIKPWHIGAASLGVGTGVGAGQAIANSFIPDGKESSPDDNRANSYGATFGQPRTY